jgi:hypothetical protein
MTTGCIWGYWDRWHEGMTVSMTEAMRVCHRDDLHVVMIDGSIELNANAEVERGDFQDRRNDVQDRIKDIGQNTGYKPKVTYHLYDTLQEAITDCGSYPFDILFVVQHDHDRCTPFDSNIAAMQSSRAASGREPAVLNVIPTQYENGTQVYLSSTRVRKREKMIERKAAK